MTKPNTDLETRRGEITDRLAVLRASSEAAEAVRQADKAVAAIKGKAAALESRIDEIDAEIGVRERDRRAAGAKERKDRWMAKRKELVDVIEKGLQHFEALQKTTKLQVKEVDAILACNKQARGIALELSVDGKMPLGLSGKELANRIGGWISGTMLEVKETENCNWLGAIRWPTASLYPSDKNWRNAEERKMAAVLQPLLSTGKA